MVRADLRRSSRQSRRSWDQATEPCERIVVLTYIFRACSAGRLDDMAEIGRAEFPEGGCEAGRHQSMSAGESGSGTALLGRVSSMQAACVLPPLARAMSPLSKGLPLC